MFPPRCPGWSFWLATALMVAFALPANAATYRYDTVHSQLLFSISHNGFSRPFGRLHISGGWLRFDPDDWSSAATEVEIDVTRVDMGDAEWNAAVCKPALLDCTTHPVARFTSQRVERTDDSHGIMHGVLELRGVRQELSIPFTVNRIGRTLYGLHRVAGFSATTRLDREDFGITAFSNTIGQNVSLWLEIETLQDNRASPRKEPTS